MKGIITGIVSVIICSIALMSPLNAAAQHGEKTVGLRAGYSTRNESAIAGIYFQYRFSRYFRIAPNIDYIFRHRGTDAFSFNGNAHFPIALLPSKVNIYPLVGINYTSWNQRISGLDETDDVTTRSGKFGLNIGGGVEWYASPTLKLLFEGKFCWVNKYDTGALTLGIGYVF